MKLQVVIATQKPNCKASCKSPCLFIMQLISKGYNAWEVCEGKVIIFNLAFYACFIAFKITCDPCPRRINK